MKKTETLFLVDDDRELCDTLVENLRRKGFRVIAAHSAAECLDKLDHQPVDLVLLDLVLPDGSGLSLIGTIRAHTPAPILVISGRNETADRVVGLDMGADDYLNKPFEMAELYARVNAHLRRSKAARAHHAGTASLRIGRWTLDRAQMQVFDDKGESGGLTVREFGLLEALALSPNRVLSREQLLDATRTGALDVFDRSVDIQIARIRKKIGDSGRAPRVIRTLRGAGYMLVGEDA